MSDFLNDMHARMCAALRRLGVSPDVAEMAATELSLSIAQDWRGETVYISAEWERARRRAEVRKRFNGRNAREVARELGVGRATVYRLLKSPG